MHINKSVAGSVFSEDKKKILLIKRRDIPVWVLPGGGIDPKETPEEAIIREIKEETGFNIKITKKVGEYIPVNRLTKYTFLFNCDVVSGEATTGKETRNVNFFPLSDLPEMPPPYLDWIKDSQSESPLLIKKKLSQVTYLKLIYYFIIHPILVIRFLFSRLGLNINTKQKS